MTMLPGWNSLEAVGSIGHSLHITAMVVLALLVVAEAMALVYEDRKYALIGAAEQNITMTVDHQRREAEDSDRKEIAELERRLEETQPQQPSRQLTTAGQQTLVAAMSPFAGQQIDITSKSGDPEGQQFANDFASVAQQAGWQSSGVNETAITANPIGVEVLYREPPIDEVPPPALAALVDALVGLHLLPARSVTICEDVALDVIRLVVGTKPASSELHSSLSSQVLPSISNDSDDGDATATIGTPLEDSGSR